MSSDLSSLVWFTAEPRSRDHLSRERIAAEAVRIADDTGVAGLTMSAVGQALGGYSAMALYRYVQNKDGLVDLMLDRVIGEVPMPHQETADWAGAIRKLGVDTWEMVMRHPWYGTLVDGRPPLGPHSLRRTESVLRILTIAGIDADEGLGFLELLDRFVFSSAAGSAQRERMAFRYGAPDAESFESTVEQVSRRVVPADEYPLLAGWMRSPNVRSERTQLLWALDLLVEGFAQRHQPTGAGTNAR